MRIGIDYRLLSAGGATLHRGMGRYSQQQLRAVLERDGRNEYVLISRPDADRTAVLPEILAAPNVAVAVLPESFAPPGRHRPQEPGLELLYAAQFDRWLGSQEIDLFHSTTPYLFLDPVFCEIATCPVVATHYDLIPLAFPHYYLPERRDARLDLLYPRVTRALSRADRMIAISEFARREAVFYLAVREEKIDVACPIADPAFRPLTPEEAWGLLGRLSSEIALPEGFLLTVSHVHYSKNLDTLLRAYASMSREWRRRRRLIVAADLKSEDRAILEGWLADLDLHGDVSLTGFVTDDELVALYNAAAWVAHPSRHEGFGLPVLEAMRCGAAVVAGNAASIPEVLGDAGLLVDPEDPAAFVEAFERFDGDPGLRALLGAAAQERSRRFGPAELAQATLQSYERAVSPRPAVSRRPHRVALWTPLPPQESGISDYSVELMQRMGDWADLDLFVDEGVSPDPALCGCAAIRSHRLFGDLHERRPFDLILYQMGASDFHMYIHRALRRWPGVVTLHDLTWSHQAHKIRAKQGRRSAFVADLVRAEGQEAADEFARLLAHGVNDEELEAFLNRWYLLREIVAASRAVIVHLASLKEELERRYPGARVFSFPMGVSDPQAQASVDDAMEVRLRAGIPPHAFLLGMFGIADGVKRVDTVLRALAAVARQQPETHLVVVGGASSPGYASWIRKYAAEIGVGHRVHFLGRVAREELDPWLIACDLVVNLRFPFRKQMSATLLRGLAAGKPVVVSTVPDWQEVPEACCPRIAPGAGEESALADLFLLLGSNPPLRREMSNRARRYYLEHATLEAMSEHYRQVAEELLAEPFVLQAGKR